MKNEHLKSIIEKYLLSKSLDRPDWFKISLNWFNNIDDFTNLQIEREYQNLLYESDLVGISENDLKLIFPNDQDIQNRQDDEMLILKNKSLAKRYLERDDDLFREMYIKSNASKEILKGFNIQYFSKEVGFDVGIYTSGKTIEKFKTCSATWFGFEISLRDGNINNLKIRFYGDESNEGELLKSHFEKVLEPKSIESVVEALKEIKNLEENGTESFLREIKINNLLD